MITPLELDAIRRRHNSTVYNCANAELRLSPAEDDRRELLYEVIRLREQIAALQVLADAAQAGYLWDEVERLRAELARRDEQIAAVGRVMADARPMVLLKDIRDALDGAA